MFCVITLEICWFQIKREITAHTHIALQCERFVKGANGENEISPGGALTGKWIFLCVCCARRPLRTVHPTGQSVSSIPSHATRPPVISKANWTAIFCKFVVLSPLHTHPEKLSSCEDVVICHHVVPCCMLVFSSSMIQDRYQKIFSEKCNTWRSHSLTHTHSHTHTHTFHPLPPPYHTHTCSVIHPDHLNNLSRNGCRNRKNARAIVLQKHHLSLASLHRLIHHLCTQFKRTSLSFQDIYRLIFSRRAAPFHPFSYSITIVLEFTRLRSVVGPTKTYCWMCTLLVQPQIQTWKRGRKQKQQPKSSHLMTFCWQCPLVFYHNILLHGLERSRW